MKLRRWLWSLVGRCECRARLVYDGWSECGGFGPVVGCINTKCPRFAPHWEWDGKR